MPPCLLLPSTAFCVGGNSPLDDAVATSGFLIADLDGHTIVGGGVASSTIASVDGGVVLFHDCFLSFLNFEVLPHCSYIIPYLGQFVNTFGQIYL